MFLPLLQVTINIQDQASKISPISNFSRFMVGGLRAVLIVGAFLAFGYMVLGAIDWITAGGESGKIESARKKIMHAVIGLAILACVWVIFSTVQYFLGLNTFGASTVNGGAAGTSNSGTGTCAGGVAVNSVVSDGGNGGYCSLNGQPTAANVKCVAAGQGSSKLSYPHFEPVSCISGSKSWNWQGV